MFLDLAEALPNLVSSKEFGFEISSEDILLYRAFLTCIDPYILILVAIFDLSLCFRSEEIIRSTELYLLDWHEVAFVDILSRFLLQETKVENF